MFLEEPVDAKENSIIKIDYELLAILLKDHTTQKNIIWATDNYIDHGYLYGADKEMRIDTITGWHGMVIKPRTKKSKEEQLKRIKDKAEVFTPSWVCNRQNNMIDKEWFDDGDGFNSETKNSWKTKKRKIKFKEKSWQEYVKDLRLEISCGEAPYLVSRYDTVSGKVIPVNDRIGLLDRKLRIINENVNDFEDWFKWVIEAYKSIYGYDWQGDNVLIARENLLYDFADNYKYKFNKDPEKELLKEVAEIISWNIFQMDGIKYVVPNSCCNHKIINYTIFGEEIIADECQGCKKGNIHLHNGIYVRIMNWKTNRKMKFITLLNRRDEK